MKIDIDPVKLRQFKIFVATPMYGGNCSMVYTRSLCDLTTLCTKLGIELRNFFLANESLVTRARNYCAESFLSTDYTHLMFIDSDIGFNPYDVLTLLALQSAEDSPYDVIGGAYPKKCISWEKIKTAVERGVANEDPNRLEDCVGDFVINPIIKEGTTTTNIPIFEPAEVSEIGTGFMMIRRATFEKYRDAFPDIMYRPDHLREHGTFGGSKEIGMFFQAHLDPVSKRYLSEDYSFCQNVRKMGGKVWMCGWMRLQHFGSYVFSGNLAAIASIGAPATISTEQARPQALRPEEEEASTSSC